MNDLNLEELTSLKQLVLLEQIDIIDDDENEYWNTIRRKLDTILEENELIRKLSDPNIKCFVDNEEVDCETWD